jgi:hypothetical protein
MVKMEIGVIDSYTRFSWQQRERVSAPARRSAVQQQQSSSSSGAERLDALGVCIDRNPERLWRGNTGHVGPCGDEQPRIL